VGVARGGFQILKRLSKGRPCDISGIRDYRMIDTCGGVQWAYSEEAARQGPPAPQRRLFEAGRFYHADGRARFLFEAPRRMPEPPNDEYPLVLLTGRGTASQWHTQTPTKKSAVLRKLYPQKAYVEVSPDNAGRLGVEADESVFIESRRGRMRARVFVTPCVQSGQVFIPMHYEGTKRLTDPVFDPYSEAAVLQGVRSSSPADRAMGERAVIGSHGDSVTSLRHSLTFLLESPSLLRRWPGIRRATASARRWKS
jgi:assimilatory nitrate reductase catalytic subunit